MNTQLGWLVIAWLLGVMVMLQYAREEIAELRRHNQEMERTLRSDLRTAGYRMDILKIQNEAIRSLLFSVAFPDEEPGPRAFAELAKP